MKNLLFLIFIVPVFTFAQCPEYVNGTYDQAKQLVTKASEIFKVPLPTDQYGRDFKSDNRLSWVHISRFENGLVKSISIRTTAANADSLLNSYLLPMIRPCATKQSPTWIFWNKQKIVFTDNGEAATGEKLKAIDIESAM